MRFPVAICGLVVFCIGPAVADAPSQTPPPPIPPEEAASSGPAPEKTEEASEAPASTPEPPASPDPAADHEVNEPSEPVIVAPPDAGPSETDIEACLADLSALNARFERAEPIDGEGPCGAKAPIRLSEVGGIALEPPVTLRCPVVLSTALWIDRVVAPLADLYLDKSLSYIVTSTAYQCRKRRGDGTAKWSEHAFANAIDVMGVGLDDGTRIGIAKRSGSSDPARSFQAGIRGGACAFFTTVLGPTTNSAHSDHLHLDMAERNGGYRLCE